MKKVTLYSKDGKAVSCEKDQVEIMKKAGFTAEKPAEKNAEKPKKEEK